MQSAQKNTLTIQVMWQEEWLNLILRILNYILSILSSIEWIIFIIVAILD